MNLYSPGVSYTQFYGLILFITILFGAFNSMDKKKKMLYVIVTFFVFFLVMGFKNFEMGNDTRTYVAFFNQISICESPDVYLAKSDLEVGYVWLNWLIAKYFDDVRALFIIYAAFINLSIGRFVYKYVDNPGVFVCLFLGLTQFDFFLSSQRQAITIAIFLYAFDALVQNKRLKYLILCGIAVLFHHTAIIMLLIYPLISSSKIENAKTSNIKTIIFLVGLTVFATVFLNQIYDLIVSIYPKYAYYKNSELMDGQPRLAVFLKAISYVLILLFPKWFGVASSIDTHNYNRGERLSMINIAIMTISGGAPAFMRFSPVFNLYANMHFSNTSSKINRNDKMLILVLVISFSFLFGLTITILKTPEWQTTYPIKLEI